MKYNYQIYRLVDKRFPVTHEDYVRYVGRTHQYLRQRLSNHLATRNDPTDAKAAWLRELKSVNFEPEIQLVEVVPAGSTPSASSRERHWIDYHDKVGYNLLNHKKYGDVVFPDEIDDVVKARRDLNSVVKAVKDKAEVHTGYAEHIRRSDVNMEELERRLLERIEQGEFESSLAEKMKEALVAKKPPPPTSFASNLKDMPALRHYLAQVGKHGPDHYVFYLGKEPTDAKRQKVEELKVRARAKGWKDEEHEEYTAQ